MSLSASAYTSQIRENHCLWRGSAVLREVLAPARRWRRARITKTLPARTSILPIRRNGRERGVNLLGRGYSRPEITVIAQQPVIVGKIEECLIRPCLRSPQFWLPDRYFLPGYGC